MSTAAVIKSTSSHFLNHISCVEASLWFWAAEDELKSDKLLRDERTFFEE